MSQKTKNKNVDTHTHAHILDFPFCFIDDILAVLSHSEIYIQFYRKLAILPYSICIQND